MTFPTEVKLTSEQDRDMTVARVGFMNACPFFAHYYYAEMREVPTMDVPSAATDGRHIFYNPVYLSSLKPIERVFVLAHEVAHVIFRDVQRASTYRKAGTLKGKPYDDAQMNVATDYRINAALIEQGIGQINPDWLYDKRFNGDHLPEDIYPIIYKKLPTGNDGMGIGQPGQGQGQGNSTFRGSGNAPKGAKGDPTAAGQGGGFDTLMEPPTDPVTGKVDLPDEATFKEAVARASAAANAMGKMPAGLQRIVDELLQPQVDWRDHIRLVMTGIFGSRGETWTRPNRRRLVLNPLVILPGRRGNGADTVVVARDTSGSVSAAELAAYTAEIAGILADVRPKRVVLIDCDAAIQQVQDLHSLDDAADAHARGAKGGGGTSFVPVFDWIAKNLDREPDALVYCTDMMGSFPSEAPSYPVVWAATTDHKAKFGDHIRLKA
jgi:predicted metal-dependent peptidase